MEIRHKPEISWSVTLNIPTDKVDRWGKEFNYELTVGKHDTLPELVRIGFILFIKSYNDEGLCLIDGTVGVFYDLQNIHKTPSKEQIFELFSDAVNIIRHRFEIELIHTNFATFYMNPLVQEYTYPLIDDFLKKSKRIFLMGT